MAEDKNEGGEKEFEATEAKKRKAREEGEVANSKEFNALAVYAGLVLAIAFVQFFAGGALFNRLAAMLYHPDRMSAELFGSSGSLGAPWISELLLAFLPLLLIPAAFTIAALLIQRAVAFSGKKIKPDLKKINPFDNLKQKFGAKGLTEFAKDSAKMLFVGAALAVILWLFVRDNHSLSAVSREQVTATALGAVMSLLITVVVFQGVLALIDLPLQRQLLNQKLKMTREEMKKETKESEGDPHFKQARRQRAAEIASSRMLSDAAGASVVMTNPEHYAIALKWDPAGNTAPICVAKGVDHMAARIREVAAENGIPIYPDPPTARSIYRLVDLGEEIKQEHFAAVAAAVSFADRIRSQLRKPET